MEFQSTLPAGEATHRRQVAGAPVPISIHASREGSDTEQLDESYITVISIHASRRGSDIYYGLCDSQIVISIHASREGSDSSFRNSSKT